MDQIAGLLEKFAIVVGVQINRLWPEMVRVYWIRAIIDLALMPVLIAALLVAGLKMAKIASACFDGSYDHEAKGITFAISAGLVGLAGTIIGLVYVFSLGTMVAAIWYPEATCVNSLLEQAKK